MRKKHRRQLSILAVAYAFLLSCGGVNNSWATASGSYTDLLPPGAAANTVLINRGPGSGWAAATMATSQTFGDSLSRVPYTAMQIYISSTVANTTTEATFTSLTGASYVGSRTFPQSWLALGRSIRITMGGKYSTTGAPNMTFAVKLGTTSVMTTGAVAGPATQTNQPWSATAVVTVTTTTATALGLALQGNYDITLGSGTIGTAGNWISFSTYTVSAVSIDAGGSFQVNPSFTWGTASSSNALTIQKLIVEFLN